MAHATSTGHALSDRRWLDLHAEAARVEYDAALAFVGIAPGAAVLDAGCGAGAFLPGLLDAVGPDGAVTAVDVAPENVALAATASPSPRLTVRQADVVALPFPDASFDVVWSANVVQYLTPDQFDRTILGFLRVLKPGGLIALKDYDVTMLQMYPLDDRRFLRFLEARMAAFERRGVLGTRCGPELPSRLRALGVPVVRRRGFMVERWTPLSEAERAFVRSLLTVFCELAAGYELSDDDRRYWRDVLGDVDAILDAPDFRFREGFVVACATAPT